MPGRDAEYEYDVALSFAGEDRSTVERLANLLRQDGFSVFYDDWKKSDLWGRDLYQHLDEVYSKKARFCVVFLSTAYAAKAWTNHELKSAQARAFEKNEEYILPVRLDDTVIPGIRRTVGYLDLRQHSIEEVAAIAAEKIRSARSCSREASLAQQTNGGTPPKNLVAPLLRADNLQIKKQFTEHDRDTFLEEAFEQIAHAFETSLAELQTQHPGIVGKYRRVNANHFTAAVYRDGRSVGHCGIRMGGMFGRNQIVYSSDPNSTNSMNEAVTVEDDGQAMFLKSMGMAAMFSSAARKEKLTPHCAAELFWGMLLAPLQR
jgi:hypothetical protein